ncbi:hypothetical protein Tco_1024315 [Tanacetum coccineum]
MIGKINLLWKMVSEKLNNVSTTKNAGNQMAPKSIAAISHDKRKELRKKGIKSPSKLLSPKYLFPASLKELNKNPTAPKLVHFVNSIVILSSDSDTEEEDVSLANACNLNAGGMIRGKEEVKEHGTEETEMKTSSEVDGVSKEEEDEFMTDEEVVEILEEEGDDEDDVNFNSFPKMEELTHHEWLLKNPRPSWTGLVYNEEEGTAIFKHDDEKITFKMPHTIKIFEQRRLMGLSIDSIPPSAYEDNFGNGRTPYYQSLLIGYEYKHDKGDRRGVRHLLRL